MKKKNKIKLAKIYMLLGILKLSRIFLNCFKKLVHKIYHKIDWKTYRGNVNRYDKKALKTFPVFDFLSEIYVGKIIHYEWLIRRYHTIETGGFSRESLDYNQGENISAKEYYLDSAELSNDDQKVLVRSTELPSVAFMRDSNAGNAFLKINTIDGRLYARLRTAIKDYQEYAKSRRKQ